jgi:hypothetical protein
MPVRRTPTPTRTVAATLAPTSTPTPTPTATPAGRTTPLPTSTPTVTPTPIPTPTPAKGRGVSCDDFKEWEEAQKSCEGTEGDPYGLDPGKDGIACEGLPGAPKGR